MSQNIIIKKAMVAPCNHRVLIGNAIAKNYKPLGGETHPTKFECPACKKVQTERAAKGKRTPIEAAFKRAYKFHNGVTKLNMLACRCGYREVEERAESIKDHMVATHGGTCTAVKGDGSQCTNQALPGTPTCGIPAHKAQAATKKEQIPY